MLSSQSANRLKRKDRAIHAPCPFCAVRILSLRTFLLRFASYNEVKMLSYFSPPTFDTRHSPTSAIRKQIMTRFALQSSDPDDTLSAAPRPSRLRRFIALGAVIGLCYVGGKWYGTHFAPHTEPDSGPLLVAIRNIGELHSASYTMKDVLREESQEEPKGIFSSLPGADTVTHWATRNRALIVAEGTVEAGIDLSRLSPADIVREKQPDGTMLLHVHLPPVTVFPPNVHVRVEDHQRGLLWRDENIAPKAQTEAASRFLAAAETDGIRHRAQRSAIETLQKMQTSLGNANVVFTF